jgi:hypothetical protein
MQSYGSIDEFFGDQSSESDCDAPNEKGNKDEASAPFGAAADHDYRSRESNIKTLSYLDGYDETKEEKLQDGFCDGYRQGFKDAFRIGQQLGSLSANVALDHSFTNSPASNSSPESNDSCAADRLQTLHKNAELIHAFLTNNMLIGSDDQEKDEYTDQLNILATKLQTMGMDKKS